jgi:subtilisin-like proprotein convertase family protein
MDPHFNSSSISIDDDKLKVRNGYLHLEGSYGDYKVRHVPEGIEIIDLKPNGFGSKIFYKHEKLRKLSFDDVYSVDVRSTTPMHVKDVVNITKDGKPIIIKAAALVKNDIDYHDSPIHITKVIGAKGGTVKLDDKGDIIFIPDMNYKGIMSFKYHVKNEMGSINFTDIPVYLHEPHHPNDPKFHDQWPLEAINVLPAWDQGYSGKGIKVALLDDGLLPKHPDLENNVEYRDPYHLRYDFNPDLFSHAVSVASVIAAEKNDKEIVGIAYNSKISSFQTPFMEISRVKLDWMKSYDVINNSWGTWSYFTDFDDWWHGVSHEELMDKFMDGFKAATSEGRNGLGSNIVFSSGNARIIGHDTNHSPLTNSPYVIAVGGINRPEELNNLGNYTPERFANPGATVLVSAPSSNYLMLGVDDAMIDSNGQLKFKNTAYEMAGTSFSAPTVSAVIALILEANPKLGWRDIQEILAYSATKYEMPGVEWKYNAAENWNNGGLHYSYELGYGQVDAYAAVKLAETWTKTQTSKNQLNISKIAPKSYSNLIYNNNLVNKYINVSENMEIEFAQIDLSMLAVDYETWEGNLNKVKIVLTSPKGTESVLLNHPGDGPDDFPIVKGLYFGPWYVNWAFGSNNFKGEMTEGNWKIEIRDGDGSVADNPSTEKAPANASPNWSINLPSSWLDSINIKFYGRDAAQKEQLIFTEEFDSINSNQSSCLIEVGKNQKFDTINTATIRKGTNIDLTTSLPSQINDKEVKLASDHHIVKAITGDGDDIVAGNKDTIGMWLGGGNNIYKFAPESKTFAYYPKIDDKANFHDMINGFVPGSNKIKFGPGITFEDIQQFLPPEGEKVHSFIGNDKWNITLVGVNHQLTEDDFEFGEF